MSWNWMKSRSVDIIFYLQHTNTQVWPDVMDPYRMMLLFGIWEKKKKQTWLYYRELAKKGRTQKKKPSEKTRDGWCESGTGSLGHPRHGWHTAGKKSSCCLSQHVKSPVKQSSEGPARVIAPLTSLAHCFHMDQLLLPSRIALKTGKSLPESWTHRRLNGPW